MSSERRHTLRFETFCLVEIQSPERGASVCVARNVSEGGIFLQTDDPLPLGTPIRVCFSSTDQGGSRISALGEVKNHYFLQYNVNRSPCTLNGMGVRFIKFEHQPGRQPSPFGSLIGATVH